ncbi:MAG: hypothetical protein UY35_C0001G0071 [Candidatus Saccharibacteria bacterium GW2011_GWC2_48_9]|nr:MAG: hypothetical protein UY35_C0001G0071 [Candidatus Saccharibacteria bacterium GW2011_GWC2_48_9]HCH33974.1 hypothetical protein [Candidatus Saccharibacteria bacterium]
MFSTISSSVREWGEKTDSRQKLQHAYLGVTLVLVLSAGIIGLINYDLGQKILLGAFVCVVVFLVNAVAWALLQSFVLLRIATVEPTRNNQPTAATKKPVTRKRK